MEQAPAPQTSPVLLSLIGFNAEISIFSCLTKQAQRQIPLSPPPLLACYCLLPTCVALCSMGSVLPCTLRRAAKGQWMNILSTKGHVFSQDQSLLSKNVLCSSQEILWHPLWQALCPAAFSPRQEDS